MSNEEIPSVLKAAMNKSVYHVVWGECRGDKDDIDFDAFIDKAIECCTEAVSKTLAQETAKEVAITRGLNINNPQEMDIWRATTVACMMLTNVFGMYDDGMEMFSHVFARTMKALSSDKVDKS